MSEPSAKPKLSALSFGLADIAAARYAKYLRRYLFRRLGSYQDVDDLAQKVYMKLLRIGNADLQVRNPLAFFYTVARRVVADHRAEALQERTHFVEVCESSEDTQEGVSDALSDRLEEHLNVQQQIENALRRISPKQAAVLLMIKRDGMSYEEVALRLNVSVEAIHKGLQRARAELRREIWDQEEN